jgi:hypothetical protein
MDFVRDAALGVRLRDLLIRVVRARVPYEAVGVRLRLWRSGRLRWELFLVVFGLVVFVVVFEVMLGCPFVSSRAAGRGRGGGEVGDRSICRQPAGAGLLSFSRLLGAFFNDANPI